MKLKHEDAILKEVARKNIEGFAQLLGIESKVKEIYPTDGLHFDPKQFQADMVYLLEEVLCWILNFKLLLLKRIRWTGLNIMVLVCSFILIKQQSQLLFILDLTVIGGILII